MVLSPAATSGLTAAVGRSPRHAVPRGLASTISEQSSVRHIRSQIGDLAKSNPDVKTKAEFLIASQKTIEETDYQTQNRSDQDPLNFAIRLNITSAHSPAAS